MIIDHCLYGHCESPITHPKRKMTTRYIPFFEELCTRFGIHFTNQLYICSCSYCSKQRERIYNQEEVNDDFTRMENEAMAYGKIRELHKKIMLVLWTDLDLDAKRIIIEKIKQHEVMSEYDWEICLGTHALRYWIDPVDIYEAQMYMMIHNLDLFDDFLAGDDYFPGDYN